MHCMTIVVRLESEEREERETVAPPPSLSAADMNHRQVVCMSFCGSQETLDDLTGKSCFREMNKSSDFDLRRSGQVRNFIDVLERWQYDSLL